MHEWTRCCFEYLRSPMLWLKPPKYHCTACGQKFAKWGQRYAHLGESRHIGQPGSAQGLRRQCFHPLKSVPFHRMLSVKELNEAASPGVSTAERTPLAASLKVLHRETAAKDRPVRVQENFFFQTCRGKRRCTGGRRKLARNCSAHDPRSVP